MIRTFTTLALLLPLALASQNLTSAAALLEKVGPLNNGDHELHLRVYNNTGSALDLEWHRSSNALPGSWSSAICDWFLCQDTATSVYAPPIPLNDSAIMICHFYDDGTTNGTGEVELALYDPLDSANTNVSMTFRFTSWPVGVEKPDEQSLKVYPNPTSSIITVAHGVDAQVINLYSVTGALLQSYNARGADATVVAIGEDTGTVIVEVVRSDGSIEHTRVTKQ